MKSKGKAGQEIEEIEKNIATLKKEIKTLTLEIASIAQCHSFRLMDLKSRKKVAKNDKENALKELESKRKSSKKSKRLKEEIETSKSEIAWLCAGFCAGLNRLRQYIYLLKPGDFRF